MKNRRIFRISEVSVGILCLLMVSVNVFAQNLSWDLSWEHYTGAAKKAFMKGDYEGAEKLLTASLNKTKKFAKTDYRLTITYSNLGLINQIQKKYSRAETYYTKSLTIKRQTLPPNDPSIAREINNLATIMVAQGKYSEAEELFKEALSINEKAFGKEDLTVATNLGNLATIYAMQGDYPQAEKLYLQALEIREKALGPNHQEVGIILLNLGQVYRLQGQNSKAEPLMKRATAIIEAQPKGPAPAVAQKQHPKEESVRTPEQKILAEKYQLSEPAPAGSESPKAPQKKVSWIDLRSVGQALINIFK
jgi:tetratricopeptide (TPR) repeat protein